MTRRGDQEAPARAGVDAQRQKLRGHIRQYIAPCPDQQAWFGGHVDPCMLVPDEGAEALQGDADRLGRVPG